MMGGLHNGAAAPDIAAAMQAADAKLAVEPLENNSELGIYLRQTSQDKEVYFSQFNPKSRLLASAGGGFIAHLWDLRGDDFAADFKKVEIPHVRPKDQDAAEKAVCSIHWNVNGDKLLTSSSDMVARVWQVNNDGDVEILRAKNFDEYLMQSKFCDDADNLVATGGIMSKIHVWDCSSNENAEVACFDHSVIDPNFKGLEIEWQNSKQVAVAGKSKFIYLWSIEQPS